VLMTAVTTLLAPPLMRYVFRDEIKHREEEVIPAPVQL
jgi:hypothetical protein